MIEIFAEIGHNHNGNIPLAKTMIEEAKSCGAGAVKFQLYDTDRIKKWYQSRYAELKVAELSKDDLIELKKHADKVGIEFFASAFDPERVGWLEEVGVKRHKLASRSILDAETIKAMEKTGKPIIASLGLWNKKEFPKIKNAKFLYCVSEYPAHITQLPDNFNKYDGFSDHTIGGYWAIEAIKRGAQIIEKHFTLNKTLPGYNQKGSAEPWELKEIITYARQKDRGIML